MNLLAFDDLLTDKLGFGKFQIKTFLIVSFIDFLDGAEIQYLSFLNVILMKEWGLDLNGLILLAASFNLGLFIGAVICTLLADKVGRRNILIFGSFMQFFTVLLTAFAQNLWQMLALRVSYGILFGVTVPISQILMTECTPLDKRGKVIVSLQIMFILGRIWIVLLGFIFFVSISEGNWRAIAIMNSIPCLLCCFGSIFYVEESARFLICSARFEEGLAVIDKMGQQNQSDYIPLDQQEVLNSNILKIDQLKNWQNIVFSDALRTKSLSGLFNEQNYPYTWRIWSLGIIISFIFGAIFLLLPFILADEEKTLLDYLYITIVEVPAVMIVYILIDSPRWGGRKNMTTFGTVTQGMSLFVIWYFKERFLVIGVIALEFFGRITLLAFIPLVTESYNTVYRSMGMGSIHGITRVTGAIGPLIFFPIYQADKYAMFLYATISTVCVMPILATYPDDNTQKPLDTPLQFTAQNSPILDQPDQYDENDKIKNE